jgi:hypothetical protein
MSWAVETGNQPNSWVEGNHWYLIFRTQASLERFI